VSLADYFGGFGDAFGYGAQQQSNYLGGLQNQMANAYNQQCMNQMISQFVAHAAPVRIPSGVPVKADCEGCGAPLKAYIHHCEYCRRPI